MKLVVWMMLIVDDDAYCHRFYCSSISRLSWLSITIHVIIISIIDDDDDDDDDGEDDGEDDEEDDDDDEDDDDHTLSSSYLSPGKTMVNEQCSITCYIGRLKQYFNLIQLSVFIPRNQESPTDYLPSITGGGACHTCHQRRQVTICSGVEKRHPTSGYKNRSRLLPTCTGLHKTLKKGISQKKKQQQKSLHILRMLLDFVKSAKVSETYPDILDCFGPTFAHLTSKKTMWNQPPLIQVAVCNNTRDQEAKQGHTRGVWDVPFQKTSRETWGKCLHSPQPTNMRHAVFGNNFDHFHIACN